MNYSVTFRMHTLRFNTCKQQKRVSGLFGTVIRIQEPILVFWSTHDEGMCSLIFARVRERGGITSKWYSPTAFFKEDKKKTQNTQIEAQQALPSVSFHRTRGCRRYPIPCSWLRDAACYSKTILRKNTFSPEVTNNRHALTVASGSIYGEITEHDSIFKNWILYEIHLSLLWCCRLHTKI